jgi:hypothetical protein
VEEERAREGEVVNAYGGEVGWIGGRGVMWRPSTLQRVPNYTIIKLLLRCDIAQLE